MEFLRKILFVWQIPWRSNDKLQSNIDMPWKMLKQHAASTVLGGHELWHTPLLDELNWFIFREALKPGWGHTRHKWTHGVYKKDNKECDNKLHDRLQEKYQFLVWIAICTKHHEDN